MLEQITLNNSDARQVINYTANDVDYQLRFIDGGGYTLVDVWVNQVQVVFSQIVRVKLPLIPYQYLMNGNLFFISLEENNIYPVFENFGVSDFLYVADQQTVNDLLNKEGEYVKQ